MGLHYITPDNSKILTGIFYLLELIIVILTFLRIFSLKKDIHLLFLIFQKIPEPQGCIWERLRVFV